MNIIIIFGKYFILNNLCVNVILMKYKLDLYFVFSELIGDLFVVIFYKILLFKYLNGLDGFLLSVEGCFLGIFYICELNMWFI